MVRVRLRPKRAAQPNAKLPPVRDATYAMADLKVASSRDQARSACAWL